MSRSNDLIYHLSGAAEELLHAAAEALAWWRSQRGEAAAREAGNDFEPLLRVFAALAGAGEALDLLQAALRDERSRWSQQAARDPAAKRMLELCDGLLAWLGESPDTATSSRPKARSQRRQRASRPPPRSQRD